MTDVLTLDQLFDMEMAQLDKEHGREPDPKSWRWSPSDIRDFDVMLKIADEHSRYSWNNPDYDRLSNPVSFWEAGSGIGTKLYLAKHQYDMTEFGFELFDDYLEQARELGVACEKRDLSDLDDQPSWEVPDIVFTARPFKDDIFEVKWETLVQQRMRPGAVLMSTFTARKPYGWPCLYRVGFRGVWTKPVQTSPVPIAAERIVTSTL